MKKTYPDTCLERAKAATPGPWINTFHSDSEEGDKVYIEAKNGQWVVTLFNNLENVDLITHARTDVEILARRLKKACKAFRTEANEDMRFGYLGELADELERMPEEGEE